MKISAVVNTWNEGKNIRRCLESLKWADEIVVVDMESTDQTIKIAEKLGAKIFSHPYTGFVEPARNFALTKTAHNWILVLDADEEISPLLAKKLKKFAREDKFDYLTLPRKNIIFGKWIKHSRWWPDYNVRFFKKGQVTWSDNIHSVPLTKGKGNDLQAKEENAILHHHYQSISQYLERLNRYTDAQAKELIEAKTKISSSDLIQRPAAEFFSRFFAGEGYKDGLHGLALALLQAFSELVKYLKVWEAKEFKPQELPFDDFLPQMKKLGQETAYWLNHSLIKETKAGGKKFWLKFKQKLSS